MTLSRSTFATLIFIVIGCARWSASRPYTLPIPACVARSASALQSRNTLPFTEKKPFFAYSCTSVISPSSTVHPVYVVWYSSSAPASCTMVSSTSFIPSASKGVMLLAYPTKSSICPWDILSSCSLSTISSGMPFITCVVPAWNVIWGPTPQPVSDPPRYPFCSTSSVFIPCLAAATAATAPAGPPPTITTS